MLFTLEPLQARDGDCLLLHWGTAAAPKLAVIDGGPGNVYQDFLRPRLEQIRANRHVAQLTIDLAMVSHVDNDHIIGIKKLFEKLKQEFEDQVGAAQRHFRIKRLWHNTFNDILGDGIDKYYKTLTSSLQASVGGSPNPAMVAGLAAAFQARHPGTPDAAEKAYDIALVLAGHGEGRSLRTTFDYLYGKQQIASLNAPFKKSGKPTLITREMTPSPVAVDGLSVTVAGPMQAEIDALQDQFDKYIVKNGLVEASLLAAYADDSITNLSSIVCLLEVGTKRILLTGDALGDRILDGLTAAGLLDGNPLEVDVLKVPHHGSDRNITQQFFERVLAATYVFSGDGKNGNPERTTLEWLTEARGKSAQYEIVLTYPAADIDVKRKAEAVNKGKTWSKAKHSLEAFFEQRAQDGFQFTLREGAPYQINLGDESPAW